VLKETFDLINQKVNQYNFLRLEPETEKGYQVPVESGEKYSISFMTNNFGGARAYALSPKGAANLLSQSDRWCMPVDNYMGSIYIHAQPSYLFKPSIVPSIQEVPEKFQTTIQLGEEKKASWYRKPTRELYSLYRKFKMKQYNRRFMKPELES
ncbi:MAG: glycosyl transferase, partial [Pseudomonadota bacterium]|nr:glycosyl transferase [Pseudomonadota bacterium]